MPIHSRFQLRSVCVSSVLSAATALVIATPSWAQAHDHSKSPSKPAPPGQMDHSRMDHSKMGGMHDKKPMEGMKGMSRTGDVDYDFAANMRMHHQMAVEMSQAQLKNGKNPEMAAMAKKIIADQKKEIAEFDQWMSSHGKPGMGSMPKK